jgi:hypothetical protein
VSADQIFVSILVVAIALGLGWLSWQSRRRQQGEMARVGDSTAAAAAESLATEEVIKPVHSKRRRHRRR